MWHDFADNLPLLRHQIASVAGREMRTARLDSSRRSLADYIERQGVDPTSPAGERLISLLLLLNGSLALIELHDRQGFGVDEAIDRSRWATQALIDATRRVAGSLTRTRGNQTCLLQLHRPTRSKLRDRVGGGALPTTFPVP